MDQLFLEILGDRTYPKIVGPVGITYQSSKVSYVLPCAVPSCKVSYNAHSQYIYILYIHIYIQSTTVNYWSLITSPPLWPVLGLEIQTSGDEHSSTAP
jgi:hypothetical protein